MFSCLITVVQFLRLAPILSKKQNFTTKYNNYFINISFTRTFISKIDPLRTSKKTPTSLKLSGAFYGSSDGLSPPPWMLHSTVAASEHLQSSLAEAVPRKPKVIFALHFLVQLCSFLPLAVMVTAVAGAVLVQKEICMRTIYPFQHQTGWSSPKT